MIITPANNIHSVYFENKQSKNGLITTQLDLHPNFQEIQKSKQIILQDLGLSFMVPQIQNLENTVVKLALNDKSRGIIDHYIHLNSDALGFPQASIVISELPPHMQTFNVAMQSVQELQIGLINQQNLQIHTYSGEDLFGTWNEIITFNRISSSLFPTSKYQVDNSGNKLNTIGVSRFTLIKKHLIEFAMIIQINDNLAEQNIKQYVRENIDHFSSTISILN